MIYLEPGERPYPGQSIATKKNWRIKQIRPTYSNINYSYSLQEFWGP